MGLFDKFFSSSNSSDAKLSIDTMLDLVTISNKSFDKARIELEKIIFFDYIVSSDVPAEYQEDRIELEEEYKNRFIISSGIISLAILEFLVNKRSGNEHNKEILISLYKRIFPNLLRIREKVIIRNIDPNVPENFKFDDNEHRIENNINNEAKFISLISNLSVEVKNLIEHNSDIKVIRSYFGYNLGQIFVDRLPEKNEKIAELIKTRIKIICKDLETFFFNQL